MIKECRHVQAGALTYALSTVYVDETESGPPTWPAKPGQFVQSAYVCRTCALRLVAVATRMTKPIKGYQG